MSFVRDKMKLSPEEIPDPRGNAITIIFTNNVGAERYMASGRILAHRLGHALRMGNNETAREWEFFSKRLLEIFANILDQVYNVSLGGTRSRYGVEAGTDEKLLKFAAHQIGSMKSARDKNLRNWYEFAYEVFAQWIITGKITFNRLPDRLITGQWGWGKSRSDRTVSANKSTQEMYNRHDLDYFTDELETMLENVLYQAVGRVFVM